MTTASGNAVIIPPGTGRPIHGLHATSKVPSGAFEGRLLIFEGTVAPGTFIPPHTHTHEDEVTFILAGTLSIDLGGAVSQVTAGAFVIKPRGEYHSFWNSTDEPVRLLEMNTPARLEPYYDGLGRLFTAANLGDDERAAAIAELHAGYGIVYHPELVPALVASHGAGRAAASAR